MRLAEQLRHHGVDCEIDVFQVSPAEGWPGWMRRQLHERYFCIAVVTETYARRFEGYEEPGTGKGATWEGRLLRQILFEEGSNNRVIPVVFDSANIKHIPLELKDVTYYDLSTHEGYDRLHRALTNQPLVERSPLGPMRKHLPTLASPERDAIALLALCPDPVPLSVIARSTGNSVTEIAAGLKTLVEKQFVSIEGEVANLGDRSVSGLPSLSSEAVGLALEATLDFIQHHQRDALGSAQLMNAVTLTRKADVQASFRQVSRAFSVLHPLLKAGGNKRIVLEIARRSIEASRAPGRGPDQAKDEAVALICGVSWAYQRTGRLDQARVEAERSLKLGRDIGWDRNTAFCEKCLGRLKRLEAESVGDGTARAALLGKSEELLRAAIQRFTALSIESEVGDCYSLLARTFLAAGRLADARDALKKADARLVEPATKDYMDLQIVKGDLLAHSNRRDAEFIYSAVLVGIDDGDVQKSEIFARAFLQRGLVRAKLGESEKALADFRRAAEIWDALEDPAADLAYWEIERSAEWLDRDTMRALETEPVGVRVRVARMVRERGTEPRRAKAKRAKLPENYLRGLVCEARERLAVERPDW
jgi:hypothetical protein